MMRTPALILSLASALSLVMVLCAAQAAASQPIGEHHDRCLEEASTQLAMTECVYDERIAADRELGRAWKELIERSPAAARRAMKVEQRAWVRGRARKCRKEAALHEGGSIMPLVHASCLSTAARTRASELRALLAAPRLMR